MIFSKNREPGNPVTDFAEIRAAFSSLGHTPLCFRLEKAPSEFIECEGRMDNLAIRIMTPATGLEILGVSKEDRGDAVIPGLAGPVEVKKNERLQLEDALINFEAFFKDNPLPNAYVRRKL
ncbi:MAG: hypothetical protein R3C61_00190 [Bacteroidia bacterium]